MTTLALDASSRTACVAIVRDGALLGQVYQNNGLTHSQTLMPMVSSLLRNARVPAADIDLVAVTQGPGSFTGLRIGVSTAAGLAWGWGLPCVGISSLEAAAAGVCHMGGLICAMMDARRGQVYNALFSAEGGTLGGTIATMVRLTPDRAISLDALRPEILGKAPILVGDGWPGEWEGIAQPAPAHLRHATAWAVAVLAERAAARGGTYPAGGLRPNYLRPSQAERELAAKR
ncbi:MAG: tRNA (adenosine(37)-N6)-threonylcarbamoyltransferase complex dimerization subunit type 1 TsaB [Oscillospiraceae bacterium]|nr:tRNA (adenosine(37)-N6)-threonylcarbamoyltransferase complex dimerization subunit type 1 TsaB [Oscillospiraceae bacterium]